MIVSRASGAFSYFIATFIRAFSTYLLKGIRIIIIIIIIVDRRIA